MKKTYTIVFFVLLVLVLWFIFGRGQVLEAPVVIEKEETKVVAEPAGTVNTQTIKKFAISGKNFSFTPATITVGKGDMVEITFENTAGFHDLIVEGYGAATQKSQSPNTEVISFKADKAGSFEYYCSVGSHRAMGMKGVLIVE